MCGRDMRQPEAEEDSIEPAWRLPAEEIGTDVVNVGIARDILVEQATARHSLVQSATGVWLQMVELADCTVGAVAAALGWGGPPDATGDAPHLPSHRASRVTPTMTQNPGDGHSRSSGQRPPPDRDVRLATMSTRSRFAIVAGSAPDRTDRRRPWDVS